MLKRACARLRSRGRGAAGGPAEPALGWGAARARLQKYRDRVALVACVGTHPFGLEVLWTRVENQEQLFLWTVAEPITAFCKGAALSRQNLHQLGPGGSPGLAWGSAMALLSLPHFQPAPLPV